MRYLLLLLTVTLCAGEGYYYNQGKQVAIEPVPEVVAFQPAVAIKRGELYQKLSSKKAVSGVRSLHMGNEIVLIEPEHGDVTQLRRFLKEERLAKQFLTVVSKRGINEPLGYGQRILVNFKPEYSDSRVQELMKQYQLTVVKRFRSDRHFYLVASAGEALAVANRLYEAGVAVHAKPDFYVKHIKHFTPNDTYYSDQWHLKNATGGVNAPAAWDISRGSSDIKIAIIDDGIDADHEDLNVIATKNVTTEPYASSKGAGSHGTSCAGVAAAIGNNGKGMSGSCPNCSLLAVKLLISDYDSYTYTSYSYDVEAFEWAVDNGADVINNSWGYSQNMDIPDDLNTAIKYAAKCGRGGSSSCTGSTTNTSYYGKGCVVVFAAGNEQREFTTNTLEGHSDIISVGATDYADDLSWYSNCGTRLDVVAPSSYGDTPNSSYAKRGIWTTDAYSSNETRDNGFGYNRGGRHYDFGFDDYSGEWYINDVTADVDSAGKYNRYFGGTSSAAPLVSGIAGIILSINPDLTYQQVREIIRKSADQISGSAPYGYPCSCTYLTSGSEYTDYKHSKCFGYGRVNLYEAAKMARDTALEICSNYTDDDADLLYDDEDPDCSCDGSSCRENYFCNDSNQCECREGYVAHTNSNDGKTTCQPDYCADYDCAANGYCDYSAEDDTYYCYAQDGYHWDNGVAVANTCTYLNCPARFPNSTCSTFSDNGTTLAECVCDAGYVFTGEACEDLCANVTCNSWESCSNGVCQPDEGKCNTPEDCADGYNCTNHTCENPCDDISCFSWKECQIVDSSPVCVLSEGRCDFPSDCESGESCSSHYCVSDACLNVTCDSWKHCEEGACVLNTGQCDTITDCGSNEVCTDHTCVVDLCQGVYCSSWKSCDAATGNCVLNEGQCDTATDCNSGQTCESHICVDPDPCEGVYCATWKHCEAGACVLNDGQCDTATDCNSGQTCESHLCVDPDPCEGVYCSTWKHCEAGACVLNDGQCDTATDCAGEQVCESHTCVDPDPCASVVCGTNSSCSAGVCVCNSGYHTENTLCVADSKTVDCADLTTVPENGHQIEAEVTVTWSDGSWSTPASCDWGCDDGYTRDGDSCKAGYTDPCLTNPCTEANKTVCTDANTDGVAECGCDAGYHDENGSCVVDSVDPCEGVTCGANSSCSEGACVCDTNFHDESGSCVANSKKVDCTTPATVPENGEAIVAQVDVQWENEAWTTAETCDWRCKDGYTKSGDSCIAGYTDPCASNPCSEANRTVCTDINTDGVAECGCDTGYTDQDGTCVKDGDDPCKEITCGANASCSGGTCSCDTGYHDENGTCVVDTQADPCEGITCGDHGSCSVENLRAVCSCDEGYHDPNNTLTCREIPDVAASGSSGCDYNQGQKSSIPYLFFLLGGLIFIRRRKIEG